MPQVSLSEPVFVLYAGLIASGYDLTRVGEKGPLASVISEIRSTAWNKDVLTYFNKARLSGVGVNPYWPRAAMLLNASLLFCERAAPACAGQETTAKRANYDSVRELVRAFSVPEEQKDDHTVRWVMDYPQVHGSLVDDARMTRLWSRFQEAMDCSQMKPFETAGSEAISLLSSFLGVLSAQVPHDRLPGLRVIPNPLQSPMIADFVRRDGTLYAVIARPRVSSLVHEMLHSVFADAILNKRQEIAGSRHLLTPEVGQAMRRMQYAWDDGDESWLRVFEESLVRAASIWIGRQEDPAGAYQMAREEGEGGFVYVPVILEIFTDRWCGVDGLERFIEMCLEACAQIVGGGRDWEAPE